ncbi:uncharacterized protein LOC133823954 [Humulus lupulus]|uniref:uncharacterized protein LOC133823954 n=1 Tax=Humulus lupulus TaxID=3486 RepID=UPI002B418062|nr:uncharacterized protein LOC133823954 [Humulus lupulus]
MDVEEIEVEASFWNSVVVCMVLGANPPFAVFEGFIKRMWGKLGIERIARLNAGYTLVKFRDEVTRDLVLEAGVIHFDRKPVIVRPWTTDLAHMRLVKSVPVWVRLLGLGLQYWGTKCLSALVSTLGKPVLVDKVTKDRSMMQFARVLVEIEISNEIPKSIQILNERGQLMEQFVEFEWLPTHWLAAEAISKDNQKEVSKESTDVPLKTGSSDVDIGQVSKKFQVDGGKEKSDINEAQEVDWITPKKLGAFLETKLRGAKLEEMMVRQFNGWSFYKGTANEGRILMVWQCSVLSVEVLQDSDQYIHAYVKELRSSREFCVTFVYGRNTIQERIQLWQDLSCLTFPVTPWLVAGDFNSVFEIDDRLGGRTVSAAEMADAQRWKSMGLVDELRSIGSHYTWTNNQADGARIFSKLDRIFKNEEWMDLFPDSIALIKWDIIYDHYFCIVKAKSAVKSGFKPFRFFNMWTEHEGFKDAAMQSWNKSISAHGLEGIMRKLRRLAHVLRQFNKREIGDVEHKFEIAKEAYNNAQYQLQQDPHSVEFQTEEQKSFENLVQQTRYYDSYLRQRSKINEKFEDVVAHFLNHFRSIMGSQSKASGPIQKECFIHGSLLSLDQQLELTKPFTKKDVKNAMFSISSIKSLGPDGYGSGFFKVMWEEIGDDISDAILGFFHQGSLPKGLNNATLSLIPKDSSYSILMNGRVQGNFLGRKGLRQGDPISPFLFVLVMEYFTRLLIQATQNKDFRYHPSCKKLKLVSLCFADDLVLFCKGADSSVQIIKDYFKSFSLASGLTANLDKSRVYFGGMAEKETKIILECLHYTKGTFPLKYLGIPLRPTKWKAGGCATIIKKIHMKLHHWSSRHLSFAGRAQLIHYVLLGIRAFWMSIFLLPKSVVNEIDQLCRKFLRGTSSSNENRSKIHLTAWDQDFLPKRLGGIGFKEGSKWNKVLLAKFLWAISSKQDILWVLEKAVKNNKVNVSKLYVQLLNKERVPFAHVESNGHLFFQCQFSHLVRSRIAEWLGNAIWPVQFKDWIAWMMGKPKDLKQKLVAAVLATSVYLIWWNRNNYLFNFYSMTVDKVVYLLKVYLKARVANLSRTKLESKDLAFLEKFSLM